MSVASGRRRVGVILALGAFVAATGDALCVTQGSRDPGFRVTSASLAGTPGFYFSHTLRGAGPLARGDTLWVRETLYNVGDSTLSVNVLDCGLRLAGLDARHLNAREPCQVELRTLPPGGSVTATSGAVVEAPPGRYRARIRFATPTVAGDGVESGSFGVDVLTPEEKATREGARFGSVPFRLARTVLEFESDAADSPVARSDIENVVRQALLHAGFETLPLTRTAARNQGEPYLFVRLHLGEEGRFEVDMRWIWDDVTEADEPELTGYGVCRDRSSGGMQPVSLGARLALELAALVEQHIYGACPPPGGGP